MLELGILKTWNATTHKAGVQLVGSLTTYLDDIAVATNIAPQAMVVGNYVLVAIPGGNPRDACVVASWPAGSSGGGGGGTKIQDADADTSWDVEQTADEDKIHGKVKGVEAFLLNDAGILTLAKQSSMRASKHTDQSIANNSWVLMQLSTEDYDIQGEYDPATYKFTAKVAGLYLAIGAIKTKGNSVDGQMLGAGIYVNNVAYQDTMVSVGGTNKFIGAVAATLVSLNANDYVTLKGYQDTGANQIMIGETASLFMTILKVA